MTKKGIWIVSLLFFFQYLSAKDLSQVDARKAAVNFFSERVHSFKSGTPSMEISGEFVAKDALGALYFTFNFKEGGWVAVAGDDAVQPVLAYAYEGSFDETTQAPQYKAWMNQYAEQIRFVKENKIAATAAVEEEWMRLLGGIEKESVLLEREVLPLIKSKWNQNSPYNGGCPADPGGPGGHAYAGCVPTCMGQIMYYYRWPEKGTGSYTYMDSTYGIQHVSFDSTWYKWDNMKNAITKSNEGISELLYHLGVSCDLVYGPGGSGMYNHKAAYSLRTYFGYSPETRYVYRDSTNLDWDSIIIAHLDRKMPLYYAGWSVPNINGHAFVCDGYQGTDYFHFNFGWGGSSDGYFYVNSLNPGGNNFNLAQELIINIYPDTVNYNYPVGCAGSKVLRYTDGSITDGSGPMDEYATSSNCQWLIDPQTEFDSISSITIDFDQLNLATTDHVNVYDGNSVASPLLGSFTGNTAPPSITSTGNKVLITFQSAAGSSGGGWSADYSAKTPVWCNGMKTINGDSAEFSDGSFRFDYHNNSNCKWKLLSGDTLPLTIYFRYFDTETNKDFLKIYDLDTEEMLASLSGYYDSLNPPDPVTASKGNLLMIFSSNASVTGKGFEIYYPKSTLGFPEERLSGVKIYPNPAEERINIEFHSAAKQNVTFTLVSVGGIELLKLARSLPEGFSRTEFQVDGYPQGVYFLRLTTGKETVVKKVVIR